MFCPGSRGACAGRASPDSGPGEGVRGVEGWGPEEEGLLLLPCHYLSHILLILNSRHQILMPQSPVYLRRKLDSNDLELSAYNSGKERAMSCTTGSEEENGFCL